MADKNPIRSVNGKAVMCPSSYLWKQEDVSASDAGRTEDTVMHKKRIGKIIGIELAWNNIPTEQASKILQAFDPEYINITYLDPKAGKYVTKQFYVGDRSAPLYNAKLGLWSNVSFNVIERSGK
jgi:hypothetical protein